MTPNPNQLPTTGEILAGQAISREALRTLLKAADVATPPGEFDHLLGTGPEQQPSVEDAAVRPPTDIARAHTEVERMTKLADLNTKYGPIDEAKVR